MKFYYITCSYTYKSIKKNYMGEVDMAVSVVAENEEQAKKSFFAYCNASESDRKITEFCIQERDSLIIDHGIFNQLVKDPQRYRE